MDLLREGPPASWPMERDPFLLETSIPGIFAAGDVRHGSIKRCAAAVGEGSIDVDRGALSMRYYSCHVDYRPKVPTGT